MTNNEYTALDRAIRELREADENFGQSYNNVRDDQYERYKELAMKLDDLYEVAFMLMDEENYRRDRHRRRSRVGR